jgi:hypothetical protein
VARRAVVAGVEIEALAHRQAGLRLGLLQHDPDPLAPRRWRAPRVGTEHLYLALVGVAKALEDLDCGRLPCPVGAQKREDLATTHLQVDSADRFVIVVALAQRTDCDDRVADGLRMADGLGLRMADGLGLRMADGLGLRMADGLGLRMADGLG